MIILKNILFDNINFDKYCVDSSIGYKCYVRYKYRSDSGKRTKLCNEDIWCRICPFFLWKRHRCSQLFQFLTLWQWHICLLLKKGRDQTFYQIMLLDNISVLLENQLLRFLQNVLYIFIREHFEHRNLLHEFKRGWILLALIRLPCLELSYERPS